MAEEKYKKSLVCVNDGASVLSEEENGFVEDRN